MDESLNYVCDFLDWIVEEDELFGEDDDQSSIAQSDTFGQFQNPFHRFTRSGIVRLSHSVRTPLPYSFVQDLRGMIEQGPNFEDWKWVQSMHSKTMGAAEGDWFEINESQARKGKDDPDFVCEERTVPIYESNSLRRRGSKNTVLAFRGRTRKVLVAWSPVQAVAVLIKLYLPLRL
jgi:hypothetical protein